VEVRVVRSCSKNSSGTRILRLVQDLCDEATAETIQLVQAVGMMYSAPHAYELEHLLKPEHVDVREQVDPDH